MRNQYFGDELDYFKYSLLRQILRLTDLKLGVIWMLTPDDAGGHGNRLSYLADPDTARSIDPELFDALAAAVAANRRSVSEIEEKHLLPGATFFGDYLPLDGKSRAAYFARALEAVSGCSIVFLDPDVGLDERPKRGGRLSTAHLYLDELLALSARGKTVVVYQHYPRILRDRARAKTREALRAALGDRQILTIAGRHAYAVLVPAESTDIDSPLVPGLRSWSARVGFEVEPAPDGEERPVADAVTQKAESDGEPSGPLAGLAFSLADGMAAAWGQVSSGAESFFDELDRRVSPAVMDLIESTVADVATAGGQDLLTMDPQEIISSYAFKAGTTSAILNAPGGVAAIPAFAADLLNILRLQVRMIAALARRHGQERILAPEIVLGLLCSAAGSLSGGFLLIQGQKVLLKAGSIRLLQKILLKAVLQKTLRTGIARLVPVVGGAALGAWTWYWTKTTGERASSYLQAMEQEAGPIEGPGTPQVDDAKDALLEVHFLTLIALARADDRLHDREQKWIVEALGASNLAPATRDRVTQAMSSRGSVTPELWRLAANPEAAAALLVDLGALARRDGEMSPPERAFVEEVIAQLPIERADAIHLAGLDDPLPGTAGAAPAAAVRAAEDLQ